MFDLPPSHSFGASPRVALFERLAEQARLRGDTDAEVRHRRHLARVSWADGAVEGAFTQLQVALGACRQQQRWLECADILLTMAEVAMRAGRVDDAAGLLSDARVFFMRFHDVAGLATGELLQADIHLARGDALAAARSLELAIEGLTRLGGASLAGWAFLRLHRAFLLAGHPERAEPALVAAAAAFDVAGIGEQAAACQLLLAGLRRGRGAVPEATAALGAARLGLGARQTRALAWIEVEQGRCAALEGQRRRAERHFRKALALAGDGRKLDAAFEATVLEALGALLIQGLGPGDDPGEAALVLGRAVDLHTTSGDSLGVLRAAEQLVSLASQVEDVDLGARWARRATEVATFLGLRP